MPRDTACQLARLERRVEERGLSVPTAWRYIWAKSRIERDLPTMLELVVLAPGVLGIGFAMVGVGLTQSVVPAVIGLVVWAVASNALAYSVAAREINHRIDSGDTETLLARCDQGGM